MKKDGQDHCTWFPEKWLNWKFQFVPIGWMCKDHDNKPKEGEAFKGCANTGFFKDTWNAHLIGAVLIATVASSVCIVRYFKTQIRRF